MKGRGLPWGWGHEGARGGGQDVHGAPGPPERGWGGGGVSGILKVPEAPTEGLEEPRHPPPQGRSGGGLRSPQEGLLGSSGGLGPPREGLGMVLGCWEEAGTPGKGVRPEVGALEMWLGAANLGPQGGARWDEPPPLGRGIVLALQGQGLAGEQGRLGWGCRGGGRETSGPPVPQEQHLAASGGAEVKAPPRYVWWVWDGRKVLLGNC